MSVTEQDLEQLETYLDNALSPREADALRMRMTQEPALGAMLEELRVQRAQRLRVFEAYEGSDRASDAVMVRMQTSIRRMELLLRHRKFLRLVGSAAACFIVGFGVAILLGGRLASENGLIANPGPGFGSPVDNTNVNFPTTPGGTSFGIIPGGDYLSPGGVPMTYSGIPETGSGPYQIVLMDSAGKPIRSYRFATLEEATQLADKLHEQGVMQAGNVPTGERF